MRKMISVIVPVYKAERYLFDCVESVLSQSYGNLELILVDDGSPDNCPSMCDHYAEKDTRVRVVHKVNGGASSARNAGLSIAQGTYIVFVDSDDIVAPNGLSSLYQAMENTGAEYAAGICKIKNSSSTKNYIEKEEHIEFSKQPEKILTYITQSGSYSPYAKMYRKDIIKDHNVRYDETLKCSEDALFVRQYLYFCNSIVLVPQIVYEYNTENDNSLSKKGYELYCEYYVEKMKALERLCQVLPISETKRDDFLLCRAVHGLRISTWHYMGHWSAQDEQICLIKKSISLLSPWLNRMNVTYSFMNSQMIGWWKNIQEIVVQRNIEAYHSMVCEEIKKERRSGRWLTMIRRFIKKMIRATR